MLFKKIVVIAGIIQSGFILSSFRGTDIEYFYSSFSIVRPKVHWIKLKNMKFADKFLRHAPAKNGNY